jgi:putative hydrolase of the HAD superfamily
MPFVSSSATPLKAIFFDIDDTLFSTTAFVARARLKAVEAMRARGLKMDTEVLLAELNTVVEEFGSNDTRHYNRLLQRLPAEAAAGNNPDLLVMAGVLAYHDTKWRELQLPQEAAQLLSGLAKTELHLGVITAGLKTKQMEKILRLGIDQWIDSKLIFITDQIGMAKVNPKLYLYAAQKAGVLPAECLHIGDHPYRDVDIARKAGFQTIWNRGSGKYSELEPSLPVDAICDTFQDLEVILKKKYGLALD